MCKEDSIFRVKHDLWAADYQVGRDPNGKRIRRRIYGRTREEVAEKLYKARPEHP